MASKPVVMVIGASGTIGMATLNALVSIYGDSFDIRAGTRDPQNEKFKDIKGAIKIVKATMGDERLSRTLQGVSRLCIVTPPTKDRADLAIATAKFAKLADVKSIVVVSVTAADKKDFIFGQQFTKLEKAIKGMGVPFTLIRLPFFIDNYWSHRESIVNQSTIYMPVDPTKPHTPVLASDAGKAAAAILANPAKHAGKTYNILSNRHTLNEVCQEFSRQLGKDVQYVRVPYEDVKKNILQAGRLPEWQVDGLMYLFQMIDRGSHVANQSDLGDYRRITGREPTSLEDWVASVKDAFQ